MTGICYGAQIVFVIIDNGKKLTDEMVDKQSERSHSMLQVIFKTFKNLYFYFIHLHYMSEGKLISRAHLRYKFILYWAFVVQCYDINLKWWMIDRT